MKQHMYKLLVGILLLNMSPIFAQDEIIHDAEYYILKEQNGEKWADANIDLNKKLDNLKKKHGTRPNIIYILWDDQQVGAIGNAMLQQQLGYSTPNLNTMAEEGINFTRMYSEPSCTPTRGLLNWPYTCSKWYGCCRYAS